MTTPTDAKTYVDANLVSQSGAGYNPITLNAILTTIINAITGATTGITTLTDASTIAWSTSAAPSAKVTLAASRTMGAPSGLVAGKSYTLEIIQGGSGTNLITWNSVFKWPAATAPTLSTAPGAVDIITFWSDGTNLYGVAGIGFA
ncbi:MAG: hypothetical protein P4L50_00330 [Anaerolineaceae bacterium]|nr:hypothetical protein [Anaerolineaceae bacterium]